MDGKAPPPLQTPLLRLRVQYIAVKPVQAEVAKGVFLARVPSNALEQVISILFLVFHCCHSDRHRPLEWWVQSLCHITSTYTLDWFW